MSEDTENEEGLKAIIINGCIRVESKTDEAKRLERRRMRKSRWEGGNNFETSNKSPKMMISPTSEKTVNVTVLKAEIEECARLLQRPDLGIPVDKRQRSPSPEPIYDARGLRTNKREDRVRSALIKRRNEVAKRLKALDPSFEPGFKVENPELKEKVFIPADEHPDINFMGLLLGPRGRFLEELKKDTKCNIIIRGRGSLKTGMTGINKDGKKFECLDEPLHAFVTGHLANDVKQAAKTIKDLIDMQINDPNCEKAVALRSKHMHELAVLNGTVKDIDLKCLTCGRLGHKTWQCTEKTAFSASIICTSCGGVGHITKDCRQIRPGSTWNKGTAEKEAIDKEYQEFLSDMGIKAKSSTSESYSGSKVPLMLTNGSDAPGAASALVRNLQVQTPGGGLKTLGTTIFGGKMHRLTAGFKSQKEIEAEMERKKKESMKQPVPMEWKVERYEQQINKQYEEYIQKLEGQRTLNKEKSNKRKNIPLPSDEDIGDLPDLIGAPYLTPSQS